MHEIDANHHDILREPHFQLVTQVLAAHLNQRAALGATGKA